MYAFRTMTYRMACINPKAAASIKKLNIVSVDDLCGLSSVSDLSVRFFTREKNIDFHNINKDYDRKYRFSIIFMYETRALIGGRGEYSYIRVLLD